MPAASGSGKANASPATRAQRASSMCRTIAVVDRSFTSLLSRRMKLDGSTSRQLDCSSFSGLDGFDEGATPPRGSYSSDGRPLRPSLTQEMA
jgi:hypothetical protein